MKKTLPFAFAVIFLITGCEGWSYTVPTFPAPPPTITASIYSPTPRIVTATLTNTPTTPTLTPTATTITTATLPTNTALVFTETSLPTLTQTSLPLSQNITVAVDGCNTSIDITHGMGEVTNAFVTLKNNTGADISALCTTLFAKDEGRTHPDKTVCVPQLKHGQQLTLKLTVDSTYNQETPIQVEAKTSETLLSRVDNPSCTNLGLFAPSPNTLLTPIPIE